MDIRYTAVNDAINKNFTDFNQRSKLVAIALAIAISRLAPMPSSEVESLPTYYNLHMAPDVKAKLNGFNENLIFDVRLCQEYILQFWTVRYLTLFPSNRLPFANNGCTFFEQLSGVDVVTPQDLRETLNQCSQEIFAVAQEAINLVLSTNDQAVYGG